MEHRNTMEISQPQRTSGELAASASAALAKATIEAKFTIAMHRPRSEFNARAKILDACKRKLFAEGARYSLPRWDGKEQRTKYIEGYTIRFAETAVQAWGNVDLAATIAYEDDDKRVVRISVTDLESNISYTDEVVLNKTIERSKVKEGQDLVGERTNSEGRKVYIVKATEDELLQKVNSAKSKSLRTSGLRLIPQDILDEGWDACVKTMSEGDKDPAVAAKNICDSFNTIGISPSDLEKYLGHSIKSASPAQIKSLRKIFTAVRDGDSQWSDYAKSDGDSKTKDPDDLDMSPEKKTTETAKEEPAKEGETKPKWTSIAEAVKAAGSDFSKLVKWAKQADQLADGAEPSGYEELPKEFVEKFSGREKFITKALVDAKKVGAA